MKLSPWALAGACVVAVSCGSSSPGAPSPPANSGPSVTVNIEGDAYRPGGTAAFTPGSITVQAGTTVNWANTDQTAHTTTANGGAWDGGVSAGGSFSRVFTTPGQFEYHCSIHPYMQGLVIVQ
ncbi:MAG: cupredoxin domain-containing protein [Vicinamibacterales bacterium]